MEPGDTAPDFSLKNQDGETVRLSDLHGRKVADEDHAVGENYGVAV